MRPTEISADTSVSSTLRSDQGDDFPLSFGIGLDVSGGRSQAGMTGKLLNVAQAAADLADLPGRPGDKTSPAGMR